MEQCRVLNVTKDRIHKGDHWECEFRVVVLQTRHLYSYLYHGNLSVARAALHKYCIWVNLITSRGITFPVIGIFKDSLMPNT